MWTSTGVGQGDNELLLVEGSVVEVVRSVRRRRTISAHRVGDRIVVQVPARMSRAEEAQWVERMTRRVLSRERRALRSDDELLVRARGIARRYLDGRAQPAAVRWGGNQETRGGSWTAGGRPDPPFPRVGGEA